MLSEKAIGVSNNNFTYDTMIQYVNGLGDYWVRLVEQMIPATTIWSTGVKYENSAFHRQKHAWTKERDQARKRAVEVRKVVPNNQ